jgi:hypothetical protein
MASTGWIGFNTGESFQGDCNLIFLGLVWDHGIAQRYCEMMMSIFVALWHTVITSQMNARKKSRKNYFHFTERTDNFRLHYLLKDCR